MPDMRAAFLHRTRDLRLGHLPIPTPQPGEALLRILAVGVCGSDLHYYQEGGIGGAVVISPLVLGHEIAAVVVSAAASGGPGPGTLVAVDPCRPCLECEWCRGGRPNLCPDQIFAGSPPDHHGALAEYLAAPVTNLHAVPAHWSPAEVALLEPLGVAVHAVRLARLEPGETVAVLGAGPLGLLIVQVARRVGAGRILAVDPLEYRARRALALGADEAATDHEEIRRWTAGRGVDLVLEASNAPAGPRQAAEAVRIGGRLVLAGIPAGDRIDLAASVLRRKELSIQMVRRMGPVFPQAIELVRDGHVRLGPLVTHTFALEQAPAAFALLDAADDDVIKVVVEPGRGP
jgi:L-iditol 2-dehydrogenase